MIFSLELPEHRECPFCSEICPSSGLLAQHVAVHLIRVALFALPRSTGLEVEQENLSSMPNQTANQSGSIGSEGIELSGSLSFDSEPSIPESQPEYYAPTSGSITSSLAAAATAAGDPSSKAEKNDDRVKEHINTDSSSTFRRRKKRGKMRYTSLSDASRDNDDSQNRAKELATAGLTAAAEAASGKEHSISDSSSKMARRRRWFRRIRSNRDSINSQDRGAEFMTPDLAKAASIVSGDAPFKAEKNEDRAIEDIASDSSTEYRRRRRRWSKESNRDGSSSQDRAEKSTTPDLATAAKTASEMAPLEGKNDDRAIYHSDTDSGWGWEPRRILERRKNIRARNDSRDRAIKFTTADLAAAAKVPSEDAPGGTEKIDDQTTKYSSIDSDSEWDRMGRPRKHNDDDNDGRDRAKEGSRSGPSPGPNDQIKRVSPKMAPSGMPGGGSPIPDGTLSRQGGSPAPMSYPAQMAPELLQQMKMGEAMGAVGPNGMRPPNPAQQFNGIPMTPQQMEALRQMGMGPVPNGAWLQAPPGQAAMMQQPAPPQQPSQIETPQPRSMPPPTIPAGAPTNGRPASPAQPANPPSTPSQTNKANPSKPKKERKDQRKVVFFFRFGVLLVVMVLIGIIATSKETYCCRSYHFHARDRRRKSTTNTDSVNTDNSHDGGLILSATGWWAKSTRYNAKCKIGRSHGGACATATRYQFDYTIPGFGRQCKQTDPYG